MFCIMVNKRHLRTGRHLVKFSTRQEAKKYVADNNIIGEVKIRKMSEPLLDGLTLNKRSYSSSPNNRKNNEFYTMRRNKGMPEKLRKFMIKNKFTEADIAIITDVSQRTVRRWLSDINNTIPYSAWLLLLLMYGEINREILLDRIKFLIDSYNTRYIPWAELVLILYASGELTNNSLMALMKRKAESKERVLGKKKKVGRPPKKS